MPLGSEVIVLAIVKASYLKYGTRAGFWNRWPHLCGDLDRQDTACLFPTT